MARYTIQLNDNLNGRVVLDEVDAASASDAKTAALAAPPVSGPNSGEFNAAGQTVDQSQVLKVSGKDTNGNAIVAPTQLPVVPSTTTNRQRV